MSTGHDAITEHGATESRGSSSSTPLDVNGGSGTPRSGRSFQTPRGLREQAEQERARRRAENEERDRRCDELQKKEEPEAKVEKREERDNRAGLGADAERSIKIEPEDDSVRYVGNDYEWPEEYYGLNPKEENDEFASKPQQAHTVRPATEYIASWEEVAQRRKHERFKYIDSLPAYFHGLTDLSKGSASWFDLSKRGAGDKAIFKGMVEFGAGGLGAGALWVRGRNGRG